MRRQQGAGGAAAGALWAGGASATLSRRALPRACQARRGAELPGLRVGTGHRVLPTQAGAAAGRSGEGPSPEDRERAAQTPRPPPSVRQW